MYIYICFYLYQGPRIPLVRNRSNPNLANGVSSPMFPPLTPNSRARKRLADSKTYKEAVTPNFSRVVITGELESTPELKTACTQLRQAMDLRKEFVWKDNSERKIIDIDAPAPPYRAPSSDCAPATEHGFICRHGVYTAWEGKSEQDSKHIYGCHSREEFSRVYSFIKSVAQNPPCRSFAFGRLQMLDSRFQIHHRVNYLAEVSIQPLQIYIIIIFLNTPQKPVLAQE